MQIRTARPADAGAVEELRTTAWRTAYRGIIPDSHLDALVPAAGRWADRFADPSTQSLVAVESEVVGMAVAGPCRDDDLPALRELYALYVATDRARSGIGTALLAAVEPVEVLWVLEGNVPARAFYERHGFAADGARKVLDLGGPLTEVRYRR